uniref:CBS domain-containing protein n=1 Tax=Arundo donax TaxID=35708 RepID=A0A0A9AVT8_ARUDO
MPIPERWRAAVADRRELCWLTVEDVVRFLLSSIALFAPTTSRSVSELGVVRPATLAVAAGENALSAVPLLRTALASHTSVAVVSGLFPRRLAGEISPSTLCSCDVSVAAALAALSAGDLMAFIDWGGAPPDGTLHAVRSRLRRRNLLGMLDLLYGGDPSCPSSSSSSSSASSSSSSSDEDEDDGKTCIASPCARRGKRSFYSARTMARRPVEEAIVCHQGSSLVAVMVQAMAHRATHVWVVEEGELVGVVGLVDVLRVLRHHPHQPPI